MIEKLIKTDLEIFSLYNSKDEKVILQNESL